MTTFSQLVDKIVFETRRPDMVIEMSDYLNQTIREVHADPESNRIAYFPDNLNEIILTAVSDSSLTWDIPNPGTYQRLLAARFDWQWEDGEQVYASELTPGRGLASRRSGWYRSGNVVSFKGFGGTGATVSLAYYAYPRNLKYRTVANRKVTWDDDQGWEFSPDTNTPELQAAALELESNWVLQRWQHTLAEGLRAKTYKRLSDDTRAARCYSFFMAQRKQLWTAEGASYGTVL